VPQRTITIAPVTTQARSPNCIRTIDANTAPVQGASGDTGETRLWNWHFCKRVESAPVRSQQCSPRSAGMRVAAGWCLRAAVVADTGERKGRTRTGSSGEGGGSVGVAARQVFRKKARNHAVVQQPSATRQTYKQWCATTTTSMANSNERKATAQTPA
jgi:hypothetical protein